ARAALLAASLSTWKADWSPTLVPPNRTVTDICRSCPAMKVVSYTRARIRSQILLTFSIVAFGDDGGWAKSKLQGHRLNGAMAVVAIFDGFGENSR
ncbi:hypothetical protein, partial [Rhizobium sp. CF122]|uniref:hypothetical protein n=1 Tax=Rhizobium sp. CF122 TaxID=1144312 RepID=UPI001AEBDFAE